MVNTTHLKVLLKKDFLTLWRNKGFLVAFAVLPIGLMIAFAYIQSLVDNGEKSGTLITDYFRYTSNNYTMFPADPPIKVNIPFMDIPPYDNFDETTGIPNTVYMSDIQKCGKQNKAKYYYTKVALIAEDEQVQQDLKTYFEQYVFPLTGLDEAGLTADTFSTQDDAFNIVTTADNQPYCFAVYFEKFDLDNNDYKVQYSWNKNDVPDTNLDAYNELILAPDINSWGLWFDNGGASLYIYITEFIARAKSKTPMDQAAPLYFQAVGYGPMKSNQFIDISPIGIQQLTQNFPFFFMIIYLIPFYYVTSKVAAEKESKSREGMKMMGLNDSTYYLSWFIVFFTISVITSLFIVIVAAIHIFYYVNMFLFFCFCMLYSLTLIGWAFTIVSFLPTKRTSSIAATLFHVISYYLCFLIQDPLTAPALQYGLSIFPNICMNQIIKQIFFYNYNTKEGLTFNTGSITYQGYSFRGGLLMMFFNVVFWGVLGMYLDQVIPSQFGIAKPWNFCCVRRRRATTMNEGERAKLLQDDEIGSKDRRNFEMVPDSLRKQEKDNNCLKVRGLVKKFGTKTAVKGTSLTMYNGQIFALLGHNGAGKTTTISMLTGLIEPNEGAAEVFGIDIFNNMDEMRKILGVCPQHDVLFDFLTAEDHLRLFAAFKGTNPDLIEDQVKSMLHEIDLYDVKDQMSKTLSGGQKRKLSVAIAMIGNSKIVMLDEPTSGMDTSARRKLWEMLKKNKAGRIVILTTHYMDEADILGDRIAIMAEGDVQCTGSSLFLKNRYGVGYNLVIAKKTRDPAPQVDKFVFDNIDGAKKMQEVSSEISYQLPTSSSSQFKNFFQLFDQNLEQLGIRSYGVGITTLEEVFLKIGHGEEIEEEKFNKLQESAMKEKKPLTAAEKELEEYTITDSAETSVFFDHTKTVFKKKFLMQIRDKKTLGIDTIFPIFLIIAGLALSTVAVIKNGQARTMSTALYPQPVTVYTNENSFDPINLTPTVIQDFMEQSFFGLDPSIYEWSGKVPIQLSGQIPDLDIMNQVIQLDNYVFDQVNSNGAPIQWGAVYLNDILNQPASGKPFVYSSVLLLNSTSQAAVGAWGASLHTAFLKDYLKQNGLLNENLDFSLEIVDQPLPLSKQFQAVVSTAAGTTSAILMTIAWMMISDSLVQNIIKEKQSQVKHQMMISGCSLSAYWMGNYIADIIFQALPALVGIAGIHLFNIDVPNVEVLFGIIIFANPAFIYAFSFLFEKDDAGSLVIKMLFFLIGIIAPITIAILQVVNESTQDVANILKWFFYPFPVYSMTFGYMSIANRALIQFANKETEEPAVFSEQIAGPSLYFLIGAIPFYWILVICFENKVFDCANYRRRGAQDANNMTRSITRTGYNALAVDEDIVEEQDRVAKKNPVELPVRVVNLKKTYGAVTAVENVSFGLEYGECFALLGVSGAGKTTCFKSLTGEIYPTRGEVTISGHDITTANGFQNARKMIGYCPQFDAIFTGLTVLEHLRIYSSLKGVKREISERLIEKAIKEMDLEDYVNIAANNLSGGNKRKMSVAMAMLGNPPLVFLDEPSTGVDPQAKRFMWNIVSKISTLRQRSAVIITTHSMEEAEALCTKMGIMVAGEFKCFGSSQHIKDKFGTGYELEVKIRTLSEQEVNDKLKQFDISSGQNLIGMQEAEKIIQNNEMLAEELKSDGLGAEFYQSFSQGKRVEAQEFFKWQFVETQGNYVIDFLEKKFKEFEVLEHYGNNWKIKVSRDNYSIGFLFGMMEDIQAQYDISEYSVTQTTLEQIFNNFALEAERAGGKERKKSLRRKSTQKKGTVA